MEYGDFLIDPPVISQNTHEGEQEVRSQDLHQSNGKQKG